MRSAVFGEQIVCPPNSRSDLPLGAFFVSRYSFPMRYARSRGRRIIPGSVSGSVSGCRSDHIRSILQSPPNTGGRLRSGGALTGCVPGVSRSDHIRSIRSGPRRPEGCESCTGRAAAPFPLGAETSRAGRLEGGPVFSRGGRHVSGYGPESGRAVRAVRGRGGRLRAALWRLRDALSGSTGNGFVSGALLPLVASRAVCVGRIYSGLWRNYG